MRAEPVLCLDTQGRPDPGFNDLRHVCLARALPINIGEGRQPLRIEAVLGRRYVNDSHIQPNVGPVVSRAAARQGIQPR